MNAGNSGSAEYRRLRETFRWPRPEYFNFTVDVVDPWARSDPQRAAIRWVGGDAERAVSYAELAEAAGRVAGALPGLGLQPGDRVLVLLPRIVAWWECLLGIFKSGLVAAPGTTLLTAGDIAYRVQAAGAAAVITDEAGAEKVDQAAPPGLRVKLLVSDQPRGGWISYAEAVQAAPAGPAEVRTRAADPALLYFTSGTTGPPKMALHSHASYGIGHQVTGRMWLGQRPDDLHWNISDTGWAKAAWSSLFGPLICGATLFVQHSTGRFQAREVLKYLSAYPITTMCAAPTIYRLLVQEDLSGFRPAALRDCVAAGEPLNPQVIATWQGATGITIRDGYGQTESVLLCGNFPGGAVKPGSMGLPAPGMDVAVIDAQGHRLGPGEEGDIAVRVEPERPVGLFREYYRDAAATAACFRGGWYVTGDRARTDEDGYLWFVARADDVITSSAYRIGPFEVESALLAHPAVAESAVVGKPDPLRGEIVKAFVVLAAGYRPDEALKAELQEHVKQVTAPYKYPREIEFVETLPKTISGKIRRGELRKRGGE